MAFLKNSLVVFGSIAVGLFNRGEEAAMVTATWHDLGLSGKLKVRDLWRQKDLGKFTIQYSEKVERLGVVMVKIAAEK